MKMETRNDPPARGVAEKLDPEALAPSDRKAARRYPHAQYTHQLSEEEAEAVSRWLVRVVPLVFGAMLGSLANNIAIGLSTALVVSLAFDLSMEGNSIALGSYRRLRKE
ncbi:MAG: hypothetical protein WBN68_12860 [Sedimenticolaceae bacterium]